MESASNAADDLRGRGETEGAGDEAGGAEAAGAIHVKIGAGLRGGADLAIGPRVDLRFGGVDGGDAHGVALAGSPPVGAAEFFADEAEEHVAGGGAEIAGADERGVAATTGAADGEDIEAQLAGLCDDQGLGRHAVNGVDYEGVAGVNELIGIDRREECMMEGDAAGGIDAADALGEDVDLRAAKFAIEGGELAVGVGDTDIVQIDEGKMADSGTGEGLRDP